MHDPLSIKNDKFLSMTNMVEQQSLEERYGVYWYNPTCYAIEKIGCQVHCHNTDKVVDQSTHLNAKLVNADLKVGLNRF